MAATSRTRLGPRHQLKPIVEAVRIACRLIRAPASLRNACTATRPSLRAFTLAAMALPGLGTNGAAADDGNAIDLTYGHMREGSRDVYTMDYDASTNDYSTKAKLRVPLRPIEVDSLHGSARLSLGARTRLSIDFDQDTWSGATPVSTAPVVLGTNSNNPVSGASPLVRDTARNFFLDRALNFYGSRGYDLNTGQLIPGSRDNQLVHTLSSASQETRKQLAAKLFYDWDEAGASVGIGVSNEPDFESRFVNLGGRLDFNQKLTAVSAGLSYTESRTAATFDPDAAPYISTEGYEVAVFDPLSGNVRYDQVPGAGRIYTTRDDQGFLTGVKIRGKRQDFGVRAGLTQILGRNNVVDFGVGYTRSEGYLSNPYKLVTHIVVAPTPEELLADRFYGFFGSILEKRPESREQFDWSIAYKHYLEPLRAALHLNYQYSHDTWGIRAHQLGARWVQPIGTTWTVTPQLRYYTQSAADFYHPYVIDAFVFDINGQPIDDPLNRLRLPSHYSSDHRLSAYGTLSVGLSVRKQLLRGVAVDIAYEHYRHGGGLKLGGGGEAAFADFSYWSISAGIKVDLDRAALNEPAGAGSPRGDATAAHGDHRMHRAPAPAGVMFDHVLPHRGDMMVGYRFSHSRQSGSILHGAHSVGVDVMAANGCAGQPCQLAPDQMTMNMHMLELMYAPSDNLTLMLMPQWMDMRMGMLPLAQPAGGGHAHAATSHEHSTGGLSDTGLYALYGLFDDSRHRINVSVGVTAPTGDVGIKLRKTATTPVYDQYIHYGMQLGSGTWDLQPAITYSGSAGNWLWGAQLTGTVRLEKRNDSGFAFGNILQASTWAGYTWSQWLSTTLRGVFTSQGPIRGSYPASTGTVNNPNTGSPIPFVPDHIGPFDFPGNYGGRYVDIGLGASAQFSPTNRLGVEWLLPAYRNINGYQLDRKGAVAVTWSLMF